MSHRVSKSRGASKFPETNEDPLVDICDIGEWFVFLGQTAKERLIPLMPDARRDLAIRSYSLRSMNTSICWPK